MKFHICVEGLFQIGWTQANMSRTRVFFGLRGAEVLARPRSWSLGDTSSIALSFMSFQICVEGLLPERLDTG